MKLGFIGLGKMGNRMAIKLLKDGHELVVWNRSEERKNGFKDEVDKLKLTDKVEFAPDLEKLMMVLPKPRIVWSMLPAGDVTEEVFISGVGGYAMAGDILIDGGNAYYEDTQHRYENFNKAGVMYMGIGVSGGIIAAEEGYPLMVGGSMFGYEAIKPILNSLAKPGGGHAYFGEGGAGHFVKMVHNGMEYGIMQAIGEGFGVLANSPYNLDLSKVAQLYQKGTLVSGFMMQRAIEVLNDDPRLEKIEGYIEDSGEGRWTIQKAKEQGVPIDIIEASLKFRERSREDPYVSASFAARVVAGLRKAFGGHFVKKKE